MHSGIAWQVNIDYNELWIHILMLFFYQPNLWWIMLLLYIIAEEKQKSIDIESICELLVLVLGSQFHAQVDLFVKYLKASAIHFLWLWNFHPAITYAFFLHFVLFFSYSVLRF